LFEVGSYQGYEELRKAQAATDEKLNILIETVDRIIRNRNGNKERFLTSTGICINRKTD